jgi:single-strand DNA-binding protein
MPSVNKVVLIGHTGKDAELKYTASGQPVANLSMATSEGWKDKNDQWQNITEWHNITVWGDLAERIGSSVKKGALVYVEGKIKTNEYTDREGIKRRQINIVAARVYDLTPKEKQEGGYQGSPQEKKSEPPLGDDDFIPEVEEDDVPL